MSNRNDDEWMYEIFKSAVGFTARLFMLVVGISLATIAFIAHRRPVKTANLIDDIAVAQARGPRGKRPPRTLRPKSRRHNWLLTLGGVGIMGLGLGIGSVVAYGGGPTVTQMGLGIFIVAFVVGGGVMAWGVLHAVQIPGTASNATDQPPPPVHIYAIELPGKTEWDAQRAHSFMEQLLSAIPFR